MRRTLLFLAALVIVAGLTTWAFHAFNQAGIAYARGHRLFEQRLYEQAIPYLSQAVERRPMFRNALRDLALASLWTGDYERARSSFAALNRLDPGNRFSKRGAADILAWTGERSKAIALYRDLLIRHPSDFETMRSLADALFWERQYEAAIPLYQTYLKQNPVHPEALVRLAEAYTESGHAEEGVALLTSVQERFPHSVLALKALGRYALTQGEFEKARTFYEEALALDPQDVETIARLADCYAAMKQWDQALAVVDRAAATFPKDVGVRLMRAEVHLWAGDGAGAKQQFSEILAEQPDDPGALAGLARALAWSGDFKQALPYLVRTYQQGNRAVGRDLATAYLALGKGREAAALYDTLFPDLAASPDDLAAAALAYMSAGKSDRAVKLAQQVLESDPANRAARMLLVDVAIKQRRFAEAVTQLKRLAQMNPRDAALHEKLGDVLSWQGNLAEAQQAYETALSLRGKGGR